MEQAVLGQVQAYRIEIGWMKLPLTHRLEPVVKYVRALGSILFPAVAEYKTQFNLT